MKTPITGIPTDKAGISPFKNKNEINDYKKETIHLEATLKNYQGSTKNNEAGTREIAFKDTLIGREIIAWHLNLKRQLFDVSQ